MIDETSEAAIEHAKSAAIGLAESRKRIAAGPCDGGYWYPRSRGGSAPDEGYCSICHRPQSVHQSAPAETIGTIYCMVCLVFVGSLAALGLGVGGFLLLDYIRMTFLR